MVDEVDTLVAAAARGDQVAVHDLLSLIHPRIVRYCRGRIGRHETFASADDVAQEVCLAVITALSSYRDQGRPFLAFVYGIAAHKVADARRAAARNRSDPVAEFPDEADVDLGPELRALNSDVAGTVLELMQSLPKKQHDILVLRIVVGLSADETADAVGSTPGAVRVAQHRALTRLRELMKEKLPPV